MKIPRAHLTDNSQVIQYNDIQYYRRISMVSEQITNQKLLNGKN